MVVALEDIEEERSAVLNAEKIKQEAESPR